MYKLNTAFFVIAIIVAGIRVAFAQPLTSKNEDSPFGIHGPVVPDIDRIEDVAATGAEWVRYAGRNGIVWDFIEPQKGTFRWAFHDQLYLKTFKSNIKMFVTILPASSWDQGRNPRRNEQMPNDMQAYGDFLRRAVERYDGDGIDDAPGSPVVSIWQLTNEPDLFWKGTPADYARLLKESYKIIKEASPRSLVAIAGVGSPEGFAGTRKFYIHVLEELSRIRDNPQDRYFDIFDFHWFPFEGQYNWLFDRFSQAGKVFYLDEYIQNIKQSLSEHGFGNTPIFITETAQYSGQPNLPALTAGKSSLSHSEEKQALDLIRLYVYSLSKGIKKLFWVTLTEWHNFGGRPNGVFDNVGLIHNPQNHGLSHKKLAYYTYRKMADILGGSEMSDIQTVQEKDGIYIFRFTKQGKPIWVAWNDNVQEREIAISDIPAKQVLITEAVPRYKSGKEVADYNTAFKAYSKAVISANISVDLGNIPVFIETLY